MREMRRLVIAFLAGVIISLVGVAIWSDGDARLKKTKERRDDVVSRVEETRSSALRILKRQEDENQALEKKEEVLIKKLIAAKKIASDKEKYLEVGEASASEKNKQIEDVEELLAAKDEVIDLQEQQIFSLKGRIDLLEKQNLELKLQLDIAYQVQDQAVEALNINLLDMKALVARDKVMKIGLGIGLPLAIAGGVLGGYYVGGLIR